MVASLEKMIPEKLLSDIDKAIDSGNTDRAYELVGCSNPQHDPMLLFYHDSDKVGCRKCYMLGIGHKLYPICVLREYMYHRKELKDKMTGKE
jgi:hypothetical protein